MTIRPWLGWTIALLLAIFPMFSHLDDLPLQLWDESRLANSAIEMYETGDPLVVTYNYEPEMWSTKPPLLIWINVLFFKIFGLNDLSFRLPSALAALGTCLFLFWFFLKKFNRPWIGILSVAVLVSTPGYITLHGTRTGDYDSLLTLFSTMYLLFFYLYIEEEKRKYLWYVVVFLAAACLTKGIAGLLMAPPLLLYAIGRRKLLWIIKKPELYFGILFFVAFVGGYYALREMYNPGYIDAVLENEIGGRYGTVLEGHKGTPGFYIEYLIKDGFKPWFVLFVCGSLIGAFSSDKKLKYLTSFLVVSAVLFLWVISSGDTKLWWYTLPLYPIMSVCVAIAIYSVALIFFKTPIPQEFSTPKIIPYAFMIFVLLIPYTDMLAKVGKPQGPDDNRADHLAGLLKKFQQGEYLYDRPMIVLTEGYQSGIEWYLKALKHRNAPVTVSNTDSIISGNLVAIYDERQKEYVQKAYYTHHVEDLGVVSIYLVDGKK